MDCPFKEFSYIFKILSDETRLRICQIISCGEQTGCDLLDQLSITQSTLSYHMKLLCEAGIAAGKKDGQWMRYTINKEQIEMIQSYLQTFCMPEGQEVNILIPENFLDDGEGV